jgi:heme-degrading monooxygenase HmoA
MNYIVVAAGTRTPFHRWLLPPLPAQLPENFLSAIRSGQSPTSSVHRKKEEPMSVKILITRTIPGNKGRDMLQLFREMRSLATAQPGYISGETMKSNDRPDVFLVISTWESAADWEKWLLSKERQAIQEKMDALLGGKTHYEMFHYGLRG